MKIAIVHDWLVTFAGAERVLASMLKLWPQADLFAVIDFLSDEDRARLGGKQAKTTFIQGLPKARTRYQTYLPLMPMAIEQLDLSGYDLILSSSHAVAKGVLTGPDQLHISYVHSPIRYAWDLQHQYLAESGLNKGLKGLLARTVLHYMRLWDQRTAAAVDGFIANSRFIGRRIDKAYRRPSTVIYPPVDTSGFSFNGDKQDYYVTASRMVPYKKIPLIVQAFTAMPDKRLVVIGDGPELHKARAVAGPNVTILGQQPFEVLRQHLQNAKAFVFAAEEDFGITPVEAQACGTPVIAFGRGGVLETVRGLDDTAPTGVFYPQQTVASLVAAVQTFEREAHRISARACREQAELFSERRFERQLRQCVETRCAEAGLLAPVASTPHLALAAAPQVPIPAAMAPL